LSDAPAPFPPFPVGPLSLGGATSALWKMGTPSFNQFYNHFISGFLQISFFDLQTQIISTEKLRKTTIV